MKGKLVADELSSNSKRESIVQHKQYAISCDKALAETQATWEQQLRLPQKNNVNALT